MLVSCSGPPTEKLPSVTFVRGGLVVSGDAEGGQAIGDQRRFVAREWIAGEAVSLNGVDAIAPLVPSCVPFFDVPLGDVDGWIALGGATPDTALAFSPDGKMLAIGTWLGDLILVDGFTGRELGRKHLAESLVKQLVWSEDGSVLYAAEQSPDAWLYALDVPNLAVRAKLRLADQVGSSPAPPGDDLYGLYTLPAAYALERLPGGEVLVVATHGWNDTDGERVNRTRVMRLSPALEILVSWPAHEAADAVILGAAVSEHQLAVAPSRSATTATLQTLPLDGVQVLSLPDLQPISQVVIPPLAPWFKRSFVWNGLDFDADGRVLAGLGDGRVVRQNGAELRIHPLSSPVDFGGVAVVASIGDLAWHDERLWVSTSGSNIPWGTADPNLRPPQPHPNENALFELSWQDDEVSVVWAWRGPQQLAGFVLGADGHTLVMGAGPRTTDTREDLFGAMTVDLRQPPTERTLTWCPTQGPVFFRQEMAADGRFAVAEVPFKRGESVVGAYRVTVFR